MLVISAGPGSSASQARDAGSRVVNVFDSSFKEMRKGRAGISRERESNISLHFRISILTSSFPGGEI